MALLENQHGNNLEMTLSPAKLIRISKDRDSENNVQAIYEDFPLSNPSPFRSETKRLEITSIGPHFHTTIYCQKKRQNVILNGPAYFFGGGILWGCKDDPVVGRISWECKICQITMF